MKLIGTEFLARVHVHIIIVLMYVSFELRRRGNCKRGPLEIF